MDVFHHKPVFTPSQSKVGLLPGHAARLCGRRARQQGREGRHPSRGHPEFINGAVVAPGLTNYLPSSTLAAVVIVAAGGLIDVPAVVRLMNVNPIEGLLSIAALIIVAGGERKI